MSLLPILGIPVPLGSNFFQTTAISITPTLGAELLVNGDFAAWTGGNPDNWTVVETAPDPEITEVGSGAVHGGGGNGSANFYSSATNNTPTAAQEKLTVGTFYQVALEISARAGGTIRSSDTAGGLYKEYNSTGSKTYTGRALGTIYRLLGRSPAINITLDSVSVKALSSAEQLHQHALAYGDFSVTPTIGADRQAGVVANYSDDNNWLKLYIDRLDAKAYLIKKVTGTVTVINSWSVTYAAGGKLTLRRYADGTMDVIYNGTTLATAITSAGLTGKYGGAFLSDAALCLFGYYEWDARGF